MADVSVTAGSVLPGASAKIVQYTAGAAITTGQVVYYDSSTNTVKLADADLSLAAAAAIGIAVSTAAAANLPVLVNLEDDDFTVGGTLSLSITGQNNVYVASDTAGGIMPVGDLDVGDYVTFLGVAKSTTKMKLKPLAGGAAATA